MEIIEKQLNENETKVNYIIIKFQELKDCKSQMTDLTNQWYQAIRISNDHDTDEDESLQPSSLSNSHTSLQRGV